MSPRILKGGRYSDVVVSNALWDMGITFRGLSNYTNALTLNLKTIRSSLPEHGKLVLLGLHYVNTSLCTTDVCRVCNHEVIQDYIRCAQQYSASCAPGVTLVNTVQFTKNSRAANWSPDGTHFDSALTKVQMQYVLHALCPEHSCEKHSERNKDKCDAEFSPKIAKETALDARDKVVDSAAGLGCFTAFEELVFMGVKDT
eukprot:CAMPEP_0197614224 /NCGR_PEP_ID=MMETSP1326-20131121/59417_1 /TAXON_ID=1155430 /ORGANISM="Genus nov. species nov., Strain RCC2288" /LENGTH=199 /DNA_ID=CAMNT_0043183093 /DNA_START=511 /DNA_END=1110 /DNA_ORIENTATION=+